MLERTLKVARGIVVRCALTAAAVAVVTSLGWAFFCPDRLTAGDARLVLIAEELVVDDDPGDGTVVGIYRSSAGGTVAVACPDERPDYDRTGASA